MLSYEMNDNEPSQPETAWLELGRMAPEAFWVFKSHQVRGRDGRFFDAAGAECRHTPGGPALCGGQGDGGRDYLTQDEGGGAAAPDLITALSRHVVLLELAPYRTQPQHQAASTQRKPDPTRHIFTTGNAIPADVSCGWKLTANE